MKTPMQLSEHLKAQIDKELTKFPADQRRSAVLAALRFAQEEHGWLSEPLMDAVGDYLGIPHIAVYEVATFYSMYNLQPVGKHKIEVCTNLSCMLNGCGKVIDRIRERLGIDFNETTEDGKFTLKHVECLGACIGAPAVQIGKKYYECVDESKIDKIIDELK